MKQAIVALMIIAMLLLGMASTTFAQGGDEPFIYGDLLPDAPALAPRGDYGVGVRTLELVNPDQIDILNFADGEAPLYDRPLTVEVWYPAIIPEGERAITEYQDVMGVANNPERPNIPFTFLGRALRDAEPDPGGGPYPLVIVSHGYPGSRLMMTYLTENLASKGYIVVAIAHTESTFSDADAFTSTLLHRPLDILFVLDEFAQLGADGDSFLAGLVDAENTGLVGYSMGGYGALNAAGAGYSAQAVQLFAAISGGSTALELRSAGNEDYIASQDERIKAVVAFAPWGMERGLWDAEGLAGLTVPALFMSGSEDDVAGYENGVRAIYDGTVNADSYLLTYLNARHNVAPNPPPPDVLEPGLHIDEYLRYADSVWDERRINNINQHFVTGFLGLHLKGIADYAQYFDLIVEANAGVYSVAEDGTPNEDHTHWAGFLPRTAVGLEMRHRAPQ